MAIRTSSSCRANMHTLVITDRAEAPGQPGRVFCLAGHGRQPFDSAGLKLLGQVMHGISKLGKDEHFFARCLQLMSRISSASLASDLGFQSRTFEHRKE